MRGGQTAPGSIGIMQSLAFNCRGSGATTSRSARSSANIPRNNSVWVSVCESGTEPPLTLRAPSRQRFAPPRLYAHPAAGQLLWMEAGCSWRDVGRGRERIAVTVADVMRPL